MLYLYFQSFHNMKWNSIGPFRRWPSEISSKILALFSIEIKQTAASFDQLGYILGLSGLDPVNSSSLNDVGNKLNEIASNLVDSNDH
jgi:hypothetical protein